MHEIQKYILAALTRQPECRYRDIKPKNVEGNLFMYHLRALFKEGLVEKTDQGRYRLTNDGLALSDRLSLKNMAPRIQPKIATLLACQNTNGEWLLYRRSRQPFYGQVGFPYGKIHLGESIAEAANRELKEKAGLQATLRHVGDCYLTVTNGEVVISQMLFHIFRGERPSGELLEKSEIGESFWGDPAALPNDQLMAGFVEILKLLEQKSSHFFAELHCQTR